MLDALLIDEITHWPANAEGLWHSLISTAAKKETTFLCIIANSGWAESWQWNVREAARTDPDWYFSRLNGPPPWITPKRLEEQRRMLPPLAFARLWLNEFSASGGDALTPADVHAAFSEAEPMTGGEPGFIFIGGLDLGLVRDFSAFVILAIPDGGMGAEWSSPTTRFGGPPATAAS